MKHSSWTAGVSLGVLAIALACAATPQRALAQAKAPDAGANTVGEVIVTAQRVEQNMQKVPISVTAFGAKALREAHITNLGEIAQQTPGFTATAYNPAEPIYSIRGIGSDIGISQNAGGDPSVDVFVDGVYIGRGGTADIDAYNLERVEVLRGPQGTLFGKNAVGGLVQYVSKKPGPDPAFDFQATYGNYNRAEFSGHLNVPLIADKLFLNIGVSAREHDGYTYNETTGNRVNDERIGSATFGLRYLPTQNLEIILAGDITDQDQKGQPRHNVCDPSLDGGVHCVGVNPDPRTVDAWTDGYIKRSVKSLRGEVNWTTPIGVFTSLTGYRDVGLDLETPFFSNPVNPPAQIESTETDRNRDYQFSEEGRFAFSALHDRLTGVVGVYYLNEHNERLELLDQQFFPGSTGIGAYPQDVHANSYAVFGQVNYKLLDSLTATVGVRQTWEDKSGEFAGYCAVCAPNNLPPPLSGPYDVHAGKRWNALTPHFALDWQAMDNAMLYASVSRGFKSGGFQGISGSAKGAETPYDPEYAWTYEVGAKTRWFDNRLQFNASVFRTDYTNLQVSQLIPLCCVVVANAASAEIEGVEIEFVARPAPGLQFDGNYTYLDAQYTKFPGAATGNDSDKTLAQSPKHKVNIGGQYTLPLEPVSITGRLDYTYTSQLYFNPDNLPVESQPAVGLLGAHLSFQPRGAPWEISLWGRNLTDQLIRTSVTDFPLFAQVLYAYQPPREYGVTVRVHM
jgi:iron complex outermembrane receptor protein